MFALDLTATASTDLTVVYTSVHSQSQTVNCARTVRHVGGRCTPYMRFSVCLSVCLSLCSLWTTSSAQIYPAGESRSARNALSGCCGRCAEKVHSRHRALATGGLWSKPVTPGECRMWGRGDLCTGPHSDGTCLCRAQRRQRGTRTRILFQIRAYSRSHPLQYQSCCSKAVCRPQSRLLRDNTARDRATS